MFGRTNHAESWEWFARGVVRVVALVVALVVAVALWVAVRRAIKRRRAASPPVERPAPVPIGERPEVIAALARCDMVRRGATLAEIRAAGLLPASDPAPRKGRRS
jgi:hypothetical protein